MNSEKRFDSLASMVTNHISAMLAYWDKDLVCRFANNAYLFWFGRKWEEMVNKITMQELLGSELFEKNKPYILDVLEGKAQTFEREILLPTGETRFSLANYYPDIVDNEVKGFFVHVADITPIKLLELDLLKSNETITEQNKRLLSFANIVTHNLKSYANNMGIMLEMFANSNSQVEKEEMFVFLKEISNGFSATIQHLTQIVAVQNKCSVELEPLNLAEYVNRAISSLRFEIQSTDGTVYNNVDSAIVVKANPAYLDSIIHNFLSNAIKYRAPDRDIVIELGANSNSDEVIFSVKDNGLGIDLKRHKEDIFGMYKTFHGNRDATGVGLYLVRSQIEALGGQIDVVSNVGVGTTFIVHFVS